MIVAFHLRSCREFAVFECIYRELQRVCGVEYMSVQRSVWAPFSRHDHATLQAVLPGENEVLSEVIPRISGVDVTGGPQDADLHSIARDLAAGETPKGTLFRFTDHIQYMRMKETLETGYYRKHYIAPLLKSHLKSHLKSNPSTTVPIVTQLATHPSDIPPQMAKYIRGMDVTTEMTKKDRYTLDSLLYGGIDGFLK